MSTEENKDPGKDNPPKTEEQNNSETQQNQPEQQPQPEPQQNQNQNQEENQENDAQQNQNQPEQAQQQAASEQNQEPPLNEHENAQEQKLEEQGDNQKNESEKPSDGEGKKPNHFSRRIHQESSDFPEGEGAESPANENEEEEEEEGEEREKMGSSSERKDEYNSKELEDFLAICDLVVKPLEQKDIISRSLNNFQNNIKNSLDQIDKNFTFLLYCFRNHFCCCK